MSYKSNIETKSFGKSLMRGSLGNLNFQQTNKGSQNGK